MDRLVFEPIAGVNNRIDVRFTEALDYGLVPVAEIRAEFMRWRR